MLTRTRADGARMITFNVVKLPGLLRMRLRAALTQAQLAQRAGLLRPTVTRLENGKDARVSTLRRLADALGCEPSELMDADAEITPGSRRYDPLTSAAPASDVPADRG